MATEAMRNAVEAALRRVRDVLHARVIMDAGGGIESVHVLARSTSSGARISKDIESVLKTEFSVDIDPAKISVAQVSDELRSAIVPVRPRLTSVFYGVQGQSGFVEVALEIDGEAYVGRAKGAVSKANRIRLVACATLEALNLYLDGRATCTLEGAFITATGGRNLVLVTVCLEGPNGGEILSGSCFVGRDELEATARATLDCLNRRLPLCLKEKRSE